MPDERVEDLRHAGQHRVGPAGRGEGHRHAGHRLAVRAVHHPALVHAQGADAVAGAEERLVRRHHPVQQGGELGLHPQLHRRLLRRRVAGGEGAAADQDPGVVVEVQVGHRPGLQAHPPQLRLGQPGARRNAAYSSSAASSSARVARRRKGRRTAAMLGACRRHDAIVRPSPGRPHGRRDVLLHQRRPLRLAGAPAARGEGPARTCRTPPSGAALAALPLGALLAALSSAALMRRFGSARVASTGLVALAAALWAAGVAPSWGLFAGRAAGGRGAGRRGRRRPERARPAGAAAVRAVDPQRLPRHLEHRRGHRRAAGVRGRRAGGAAGRPPGGHRRRLRRRRAGRRARACCPDPTTTTGTAAADGPRGPAAGLPGRRGVRPRAIGALGVLAACGAFVEDAGSSWSALYLRTELDAGAATAGLGFVALSVAMTVGRLTGDRVVDRYGQRRVARGGRRARRRGHGAGAGAPVGADRAGRLRPRRARRGHPRARGLRRGRRAAGAAPGHRADGDQLAAADRVPGQPAAGRRCSPTPPACARRC